MRNKTSLISFILFLFVFFPLVSCLNAGIFRDYDHKEEFQKTLPLRKGGIFGLKNVNGSVTVETWSRNEVDIWAEKAVRGRRENLDRIKIEIDSGSGYVQVDTIFPKIRNFRGRVNYEIKVPEDVDLETIKSVNGSVHIYGPVGDVKASSTNGNVNIREASGRLTLTTTNGSVKALDIEGEIHARSTNGSIHLEIDSVTDEITASSTNGGISLNIGSRNVDADLEARTTNGSVYVDFPVTIQGSLSTKRRIEGRIGDGGPLISLKTTNGSIKILE